MEEKVSLTTMIKILRIANKIDTYTSDTDEIIEEKQIKKLMACGYIVETPHEKALRLIAKYKSNYMRRNSNEDAYETIEACEAAIKDLLIKKI